MVSSTNISVSALHIKVKITNRQDPKNKSIGLSSWDLGANSVNEACPSKTPAPLLRFLAVGSNCDSNESHSNQCYKESVSKQVCTPQRTFRFENLNVPLKSQHITSFQLKFGKKPKPNHKTPLNSYPDISDSWEKIGSLNILLEEKYY